MVIKILYVLLVACTMALLAVGIGILVRVRRHLNKGHVEDRAASAVEEVAEPRDDKSW